MTKFDVKVFRAANEVNEILWAKTGEYVPINDGSVREMVAHDVPNDVIADILQHEHENGIVNFGYYAFEVREQVSLWGAMKQRFAHATENDVREFFDHSIPIDVAVEVIVTDIYNRDVA